MSSPRTGLRASARTTTRWPDTKLACHVKASAVLQICTYVELLTEIQGIEPEWMHVALGGSAHAVERLRVDDYMAYYRAAKARSLPRSPIRPSFAFPSETTYPEPVDHRDVPLGNRMRKRRRRPPQPRCRIRPASGGR